MCFRFVKCLDAVDYNSPSIFSSVIRISDWGRPQYITNFPFGYNKRKPGVRVEASSSALSDEFDYR